MFKICVDDEAIDDESDKQPQQLQQKLRELTAYKSIYGTIVERADYHDRLPLAMILL